MRLFKLFILCILANCQLSTANCQYVQAMGYKDYSFWQQANIGNTGAKQTHPSAYLELGKATGSTKGLLLPRGNKDSIASPAYGLMIYNTPDGLVYWYNGTAWQNFATGVGLGNNFPTSLSYSSGTLTLARNGLSDLTVALPFSSKLNVTDTTNKWITNVYRRGDSIFYTKGGAENYACKISVDWLGDATDYIKGDGTVADFATSIFDIADARYSQIGHPHLAADILDLTPVVRNMFSGDSNINVNTTTGAITFTGITGGGSADGNNYANAASFSNNTLTIGRLGLSSLIAAWDSAKYHSMGFYDVRYQPIGTYVSTEADPTIPHTADAATNKYLNWNGTAWVRKQIASSELNNDAGFITSAGVTNIYTADGTVSGSRTVTLGTNGLTFPGSSYTTAINSTLNSNAFGIYSTNANSGYSGYFGTNPSSTNSVVRPLVISRTTSGTAANGIGTGIQFNSETAAGGNEPGAGIGFFDYKLTDASAVTAQIDLQARNATTFETFMNIQHDLVRINNNADTLATKAYARSLAGGGSGLSDGDKGDITVSGTASTFTIDNGAVTLAKTTGIEGAFTETTQEFTSSTSMSITLSNTPKTGKAEMYYLNGIVIKTSNISRTGTSVTLSGFTRESSDVITAKYSY